MDREAGKRKSRKYQTNPKARLKATALSMTSISYARQRGLSDEPIQAGFEPDKPEVSDPPDRASVPNRIDPPGAEKLSYNEGLLQAHSASRLRVNVTL
jgi:hypothetical protein